MPDVRRRDALVALGAHLATDAEVATALNVNVALIDDDSVRTGRDDEG